MLCAVCLRDFPADVCYPCGSVEPMPDEAVPLDDALGSALFAWASSRYASPDWDALGPAEARLAVALKRGWILDRGLFAEASALYNKAHQAEADAARARADREAGLSGRHLGVVGEKFEFPPLLCVAVIRTGPREHEGRYIGEGLLIKFVDAEGNLVVWFTTEGGKFAPERDKKYKVVSAVKGHSDYNGERQTIVTRPRGEEIV